MKRSVFELSHFTTQVGLFSSRKKATSAMHALIAEANTPERVTGLIDSYSPLTERQFRLREVLIDIPLSRKNKAELLEGQWGGWKGKETLEWLRHHAPPHA